MSTLARPLDSFPTLLTRAWLWGKRAMWIALGVAAFVVVTQVAQFLEMLAAVHPYLAWTVSIGLGVPLLGWSAWRLWCYLRNPRVVVPPNLPPLAVGWDEAQRMRFQAFAIRYLKRQRNNPHLRPSMHVRIDAAIVEFQKPSELDATDRIEAARAVHDRVHGTLHEILEPLDAEANRLIRRAAVEVAAATAISPSVLMDSLITLTRNIDLMSRLADLYYGRPGLGGTIRIIRDVLGSAVAAGALEVISDHLTGALSEMAGSYSSRILGPVGQGAINGIVTMRLGAAAKQRCRSLETPKVPWLAWGIADYRRAGRKLMEWAKQDLGASVVQPLARLKFWVEREPTAGSSGDDDAVDTEPPTWPEPEPRRSGWRRFFGLGRRKAASPEPRAEPPEGTSRTKGDPLLDSDLLE